MDTSPARPLRVAVVGSGPAGFYVVQHLLQTRELHVRVDMFDRLPTPFGLVRHGVAPDHQKIKSVTAVYDKLASRPEFRFFGNVEYGSDLTLDDLRGSYHQIVFATGAQTDRRLGIPGEDLAGSYPATEFVAWYNGHPDFAHLEFDLGCRRAIVVGVGNVAVDVARILCRTPEELASTDIADYALETLRSSRVREVWLLGRRGPVQAAFTNPEVRELGELQGAEAATLPEELELDALSSVELERRGDKAARRKLEILAGYAGRPAGDKPRRLVIRFLISPTEIVGDETGHVVAVKLVQNELYEAGQGKIRSRPTGRVEQVEAGLIFRSVGYRGVPLPGLPFREDWGTVPHEAGGVVQGVGGERLIGVYVAGWIKRGPSGVIGTNKPDAGETVASMLEDLRADRILAAPAEGRGDVARLLSSRGVRFLSYDDWQRLDRIEIDRGTAAGRPRVKFTERRAMLEALSP